MTKSEFEALSAFRFQLRRFLRRSEQSTSAAGVTNLKYQLLLHVKSFPGRSWATIGVLAGGLPSKHHGAVAPVTRCEKLGLVERRAGRADGREVEVHLTRTGVRTVKYLAQLHRDELLRLNGTFAVPDQKSLSGGPARASRRRDPGRGVHR